MGGLGYEMIEIYFVKVDHLAYRNHAKIKSYISGEKQQKIQRFRNIHDALLSICGELLIRSLLINRYKIKNSDIHISKNKYGKPFIRGIENFSFNISHSGEWVVVAVASQKIGIDIERVDPIKLEAMVPYFSINERRNLFSKQEAERLSYFYTLWTIKESYIKCIGEGLYYPLNAVDISEDKDGYVVKGLEEKKSTFVHAFTWDSNYNVAICTTQKESFQLKNIDLSTIGEILGVELNN